MFMAFANWLVYGVFGLTQGSKLGTSIHFFIYDTTKILFFIFLAITIVTFIQSYIDIERFKRYIEKQPKFIAHFLSAILGAVTPFCSCSSIPLFIAFIKGGMPFGVAMTFIITSPLINEVAVVVLASTLGIKVTTIYIVTGITLGMFAGYIMERLGFEKLLLAQTAPHPTKASAKSTEKEDIEKPSCCSTKEELPMHSPIQENSSCCSEKKEECVQENISISIRLKNAFMQSMDTIYSIWIFVVIGIAVGAGFHGYLPEDFVVRYLSEGNIFAVPLAIFVGIPLYAEAGAVIPIAQVLLQKGAAIGTVLVFMMSAVGLSLPEMIILSRIMKKGLILRFIFTMALLFLFAGYFYNIVL